VPRKGNLRSWLYRIRPSAQHEPFRSLGEDPAFDGDWSQRRPNPNQVKNKNRIIEKQVKVVFLH